TKIMRPASIDAPRSRPKRPKANRSACPASTCCPRYSQDQGQEATHQRLLQPGNRIPRRQGKSDNEERSQNDKADQKKSAKTRKKQLDSAVEYIAERHGSERDGHLIASVQQRSRGYLGTRVQLWASPGSGTRKNGRGGRRGPLGV